MVRSLRSLMSSPWYGASTKVTVGLGTFGRVSRLCARPGCSSPASATMSYGYASRTVWVDDLAPEADPNAYDLCPVHADRQSVPQGWNRTDRRVTVVRPFVSRIAV